MLKNAKVKLMPISSWDVSADVVFSENETIRTYRGFRLSLVGAPVGTKIRLTYPRVLVSEKSAGAIAFELPPSEKSLIENALVSKYRSWLKELDSEPSSEFGELSMEILDR